MIIVNINMSKNDQIKFKDILLRLYHKDKMVKEYDGDRGLESIPIARKNIYIKVFQ